jgi:hypothetical protein
MALTTILPSGLNSANDFSSLVPSAYGQANSAASFANGAFDRANSAYNAANNATDTWVRTQANNAYDTANSSGSFANGAFITANSGASFANAAFDRANAAYTQANTGGGGSGSVTIGPSAPTGVANGALWYDDTTTGELFVYSSGSWVTTSIMPATGVGDPSITGPTQANEATTQTFTIGNYNGTYTYIIGVTGGSVTRTNQSIYWTMPSVATNTSHYMTTQVVQGGYTSAVDTRTVLVINLNIDDTAIVVSDFSTSYSNTNYGWA